MYTEALAVNRSEYAAVKVHFDNIYLPTSGS